MGAWFSVGWVSGNGSSIYCNGFDVTVIGVTVWDGNVPRVALGNGALRTVTVVTVTVSGDSWEGGLVACVPWEWLQWLL